MANTETCFRFIRNSPGDLYETPACTDYCARCGHHISDHAKNVMRVTPPEDKLERNLRPKRELKMLFLTVEEVSTPRHNVVQVIRNSWWPTTQHGEVALYLLHGQYERPQCNSNKDIADKVRTHPALTGPVVFMPLAFIRWDD